MIYYPIIDGDLLVYRCGFAGQYNEYVIYLHSVNPLGKFRYKKEMDAEIKRICEQDGYTPEHFRIEVNTIIEPVGFVLNNVKTTLTSILDRLGNPKEYSLYITGKGNFRDEVAKTKVYKGNRDKLHRPAWYKEIREYLIEHWNAFEVDGMEADDAIANKMADMHPLMAACVVSTDKDLNQVPGWHFNWVKDELYYVEPYEASRWFWLQMIMGDTTDNIQGIPGMGPKKAEKFLAEAEPYEWESLITDLYLKYYGAIEGYNVFEEHKQLIKIGGQNREAIAVLSTD
jgi:hypothetical protein